MADVTIGAKLQVDTGATVESVKSVKAQLREAKTELLSMQEQFGETSKEALTAAKRVANLKDAIGDANSLVEAFNPDRKFAAMGQAVSGVTGGFTALQGILGAVGLEGDNVAETLGKVQSAMAIQQGVDQVLESVQGFKNLGAVIKQTTLFRKADEAATKAAAVAQKLFSGAVDTSSASFKNLKTAIAATGIGLLLVLVGEAISFFDNLASAAQKAADAEREALEARDAANDADLKGAMEEISRQEKLNQSRLKAQGASEKKLTDDKITAQRDRITQLQRLANEEGISDDKRFERQKAIREAQTDLEVMQNDQIAKAREDSAKRSDKAGSVALSAAKQRAAEEKKLQEERVKAAQKEVEDLRKINEVEGAGGGLQKDIAKLSQEYGEKLKIIQAGGQSTLELNIWWEKQLAAIKKQYRDEEIAEAIKARDENIRLAEEEAKKRDELQQRNANNAIQAIKAVPLEEARSFEERRVLLEDGMKTILAQTQWTNDQRNAFEAAYSDARKEIDRQEVAAKEASMSVIGNLANAASEIAGKQTAGGKALAVASTTIDTYLAAQKAYTSQFMPIPDPSSPVRGTIAAAAAVISGMARVKGILSVSVPGGGGGGVGSITAPAPVVPQIPQATRTSLDADSINGVGNAASGRAYVLESDITNNQEKYTRLSRAARLG